MSNKVKPIPDGFHTLTPYLIVRGGAEAMDFYKRAFGAVERFRLPGPDGKSIAHAEMVIGNSIMMLGEESPQRAFSHSPATLKGSTVGILIYVEDVDAVFKRAVAAGATIKEPVENKFYGERAGTLADPFGHLWTIMTHVEDVTSEEVQKRMVELFGKMGQKQGA
jgi:PhnB protein